LRWKGELRTAGERGQRGGSSECGQARPASEHGGAAERSQLGQQASTAARLSAACRWHSRGGGTATARARDLRER